MLERGVNIPRYLTPEELETIKAILQKERLAATPERIKAVARAIARDGCSDIPHGFDWSMAFASQEKSPNRQEGQRGLEMVWSERLERALFLEEALEKKTIEPTVANIRILGRGLSDIEFDSVRAFWSIGKYQPSVRVRRVLDKLKRQSQEAEAASEQVKAG